MNEVQVGTLIAVVAMLLRKLIKCFSHRHSNCGLESPCMKMNIDLDEVSNEEVGDEGRDGEVEMDSLTFTSTTSTGLTDSKEMLVRSDELDFEHLEAQLHELVSS